MLQEDEGRNLSKLKKREVHLLAKEIQGTNHWPDILGAWPSLPEEDRQNCPLSSLALLTLAQNTTLSATAAEDPGCISLMELHTTLFSHRTSVREVAMNL